MSSFKAQIYIILKKSDVSTYASKDTDTFKLESINVKKIQGINSYKVSTEIETEEKLTVDNLKLRGDLQLNNNNKSAYVVFTNINVESPSENKYKVSFTIRFKTLNIPTTDIEESPNKDSLDGKIVINIY